MPIVRCLFPLLAVCLVSFTFGEDWYRYRGPNLNGISSETGWKSWGDGEPKIHWRAEVGTGFSGIVQSDGCVYTIGNKENEDTVYCLDAASGDVIWKQSYACPTDPNEFEGGPTSTPTVDGDSVFTLSRRGDLYCFEKASGKPKWSVNAATLADVRTPGWGFAGSPLVLGDKLILNVGDAGTAIDKLTGELIWKSDDKDSGYSSPIPTRHDNRECVVIGSARSYVCVDVVDGAEVWRQRWLTTFGCNAGDAIVSDHGVFLSSGYNRGSALIRPGQGRPEVVWKNKEMQNQISSSLLLGDMIVGIHGDVDAGTSLRALDLKSGAVLWTEETLQPGGLSASADGRLIVIGDEGELMIGQANRDSFQVACKSQVVEGKCWTAPTLSGGLIYCRTADGSIVCVDVR